MRLKYLIYLLSASLLMLFLQSFQIDSLNKREKQNILEDKVLSVPYKVQPTSNTCQSTCLKMCTMYMQDELGYSFTGIPKEIEQIYKEINIGNERPVKKRNAWKNFVWWLNKETGSSMFSLKITEDEAEATEYIIQSINNGFPVILSTNHMRTKGHIIMVIGYQNYIPNQSNPDLKFVCHDPYGTFHPDLASNLYGKNRYDYGQTNIDGSEEGVGKGVLLGLGALKRIRSDRHNTDRFAMISAF